MQPRTYGPLLFAVCLSGSACGSSPTSTDQAGANVIRINDPNGELQQHQPAIQDLISSTLQTVRGVLPVTGVTITVTPDPAGAIPGYGLGGYTPSAQVVQISIDPSYAGLGQVLSDRLPRLIAHELHHAMRWRSPGYGSTLFEALISEGLADHFANELLNLPAAPWSDAFSVDSTDDYLALAQPEFDSAGYDHARWFFGTDPSLPNWTGYTLGYRLVEDYETGHPGQTAAILVHTPAGAFRPQ